MYIYGVGNVLPLLVAQCFIFEALICHSIHCYSQWCSHLDLHLKPITKEAQIRKRMSVMQN